MITSIFVFIGTWHEQNFYHKKKAQKRPQITKEYLPWVSLNYQPRTNRLTHSHMEHTCTSQCLYSRVLHLIQTSFWHIRKLTKPKYLQKSASLSAPSNSLLLSLLLAFCKESVPSMVALDGWESFSQHGVFCNMKHIGHIKD